MRCPHHGGRHPRWTPLTLAITTSRFVFIFEARHSSRSKLISRTRSILMLAAVALSAFLPEKKNWLPLSLPADSLGHNGYTLEVLRLVKTQNEWPPTAPLIITLHGGRGFGDHRSDYKAYGPLDDTYRVLSFDFRGHGQSSVTKPYTFNQIVDDIDALRKHFAGDDKIIIIGGSFGGFLAQQYAIKYPANLTHLVLRGTAPSYHQEVDAIKTLEQRIAKAPSFSIEMLKNKVFGAFESDLEFRLVHLAMLPLYSEKFDANAALQSCIDNVYNAESHNDLYSEDEKYFDYRDRLSQIKAKTLVVAGDKDWICPPEHSKYIASKIPGASILIVKDANHSVHLEKPREVLGRIREHLAA